MYDYISVDGRVRMDCLARALPLLRPAGGILLLDNSEREWYQVAFQMVPKHWLMVRRPHCLPDTSCAKRPAPLVPCMSVFLV